MIEDKPVSINNTKSFDDCGGFDRPQNEIPDAALARAKKAAYDLIARWRNDAEQYHKQVEEAQMKRLPHVQMQATMICLRDCARQLELAIKK